MASAILFNVIDFFTSWDSITFLMAQIQGRSGGTEGGTEMLVFRRPLQIKGETRELHDTFNVGVAGPIPASPTTPPKCISPNKIKGKTHSRAPPPVAVFFTL